MPEKANELIDNINTRISVITRMELLSWSGLSEKQTSILQEFINACIVYALVEPIILKAIDIRRNYKTKLPDAIIAANALINDLTLITHNTKDFIKIEGIDIIDPYQI